MKKLIFFLIGTLLLSSCSASPLEHQSSTQDGSVAPSHRVIASEHSITIPFVGSLALKKAKELHLADLEPTLAIQTAYDYLIETIYFADPVGLDVWQYLSEEESISYLDNRSLSPFLFKIGSCEDFAASLVMLLQAANLEADYVAGYTLSKDQVFVDHAWAIVNLDGNWYHLDPQLEQNITTEQIRYRFFMKTDDEMKPDHLWGENLIDYWPDMPEEEKENIRTNYSVKAATTHFPTPAPKPIALPAQPNFTEIEQEIRRMKDDSGRPSVLPDTHLNIEPPILVANRHITPPLLPAYQLESTESQQEPLS